jgi:hypothetical protein
MIYAFLLGILVALTPSLLALSWFVWRAPVVQENESFDGGRFQDPAAKPNNRSRAKRRQREAAI